MTAIKFMTGYQDNALFIKTILQNADRLSEIYFPWGRFTSGRGVLRTPDSIRRSRNENTDLAQVGDSVQTRLENTLDQFMKAGLDFNLLLNGNCYGKESLARSFYQEIGDSVDDLRGRYRLRSVTTASPVIAKFLRMNFPDLEIRASVNMEIGSIEGLEYVADLFDGFYLKREYNHDLAKIKKIRNWCVGHGKKLYLLANSGCLNFCSLRTFHDNLVAHQHEITPEDNAFDFAGICHEYLAKEENRRKILAITNFIRPEDLDLYAPYFDGVKLATRTNRNPASVLNAYLNGHFSGNLLDLTEPSHSSGFYPNILANDRFPAGYAEMRLNCDKECDDCCYCQDVLNSVLLSIDDLMFDIDQKETPGLNQKRAGEQENGSC